MVVVCLRAHYCVALLLCLFCSNAISALGPSLKLRSSPLPLPSVANFFKHYDKPIISAQNGKNVDVSSLLKGSKRGYILLMLTNCASLSTFELAQETLYYLPQIERAGIKLSAITVGSVNNARAFCEATRFPSEYLFVDDGSLYRELDLSRGFLSSKPLSPYIRLLAMLMGLGSPGTLEEIIRGYVGDRDAPSAWIKESLRLIDQAKFDILGRNYQRPFELATVRLQNLLDILRRWNALVPEDLNLLTQLGGAFAFTKDEEMVYDFKDPALLKYVNLSKICKELGCTLTDW